MWIRRYKMCVGFAAYYQSRYRYDIVHDAWLYFFYKTGENLFTLELKNESSYLFTIIKNAFYRWLYKERRGKLVLADYLDESVAGYENQHALLEAKDLYEILYSKVIDISRPSETRHYRTPNGEQLPLEILKLKTAGYDQVSIAEKLKVSKQLVGQYIKKIKLLQDKV